MPRRTQTELREFVSEVAQTVRALLSESDQVHERLGAYLFEQVYGNDPELALGPERFLSKEYLELRKAAGRSFDLTSGELSDHLRAAAVGALLLMPEWSCLSWSKKRALLPLVRRDPTLRLLRTGARYASRPTRTVSAVREWVRARLMKDELPALTLAHGRRFVEVGVRLADEQARAAFAKRLRRMPEEERELFVENLRGVVGNLEALLEEIEQ